MSSRESRLYELVNMSSGKFLTRYFGIKLTLDFTTGFNASGRNRGQLITADPFLQDAIEHDSRFGKTWVLRQKFESAEVEQPKEEAKVEEKPTEEEKPVAKRNGLPLKKKAEPKKKEVKETKVAARTIVETVTNRNDAAEWFAEKGSVFTTDAELKELMEKFDVDFPNLHL